MRVRRLDPQRRADVNAFARFPFDLYRHCAQWVPPLLAEQRALLDRRRHPFYQHSDAAFYLAESDGRSMGRIAVMENRRYNQHFGTQSALFGFFEAVEDIQVSRALFEAAFQWARQRGLRDMIGPRGLLAADNCGILVEGFEHRPAMGVAYNLPYYGALVEDAGFRKQGDSYSGYFLRTQQVPQRLLDLADRVKERRGFAVQTFATHAELRAWAPRVAHVFADAFAQNDLFYPPTEAEMQAMINGLLAIAVPRYIKVVTKGQEVVGFVFAYPDVSAGLQRARGRLWPWGWYHLLRERRRTRWADGNGIGVLPAYQGLGASILLYAEVARTLLDSPFERVEVVQVGEENPKSRSIVEDMGVTWYKTHRVYCREL